MPVQFRVEISPDMRHCLCCHFERDHYLTVQWQPTFRAIHSSKQNTESYKKEIKHCSVHDHQTTSINHTHHTMLLSRHLRQYLCLVNEKLRRLLVLPSMEPQHPTLLLQAKGERLHPHYVREYKLGVSLSQQWEKINKKGQKSLIRFKYS